MAKLRYWLWLTLKQEISGRKIRALLDIFDTPEAIYRADKKALLAALSQEREQQIFKPEDALALSDKSLSRAEEVYQTCQDKQIKILTQEHELYPRLLLEIADPPYVLYARYAERINLNEHMTIAVVGTRDASPYGLLNAQKLSAILAEQGMTVVSGMAFGTDAKAHMGALSAGGKTVAVLAGGVDEPSPRAHGKLMREIIKNGMVLSEHPPGTPAYPSHFLIRNRIISGLSRGSVIVEAPEVSGALNTARHAIEQNREVFVIPADITSANSVGSNRLLTQGAIPVLGPQDILGVYKNLYGDIMERNKPASQPDILAEEAMLTGETPKRKRKSIISRKAPAKKEKEPITEPVLPQPPPDLTPEESAVYLLLSEEPAHIDAMHGHGLSQAALSATLTMLEMKGLIKSLPGKRFCRG